MSLMTNDQAKTRIQVLHVILCGVEATRSLRANPDIADIESRMASIGEGVPTDEDIRQHLRRAAELFAELKAVNLTPAAKKVVKGLAARYTTEVAHRAFASLV